MQHSRFRTPVVADPKGDQYVQGHIFPEYEVNWQCITVTVIVLSFLSGSRNPISNSSRVARLSETSQIRALLRQATVAGWKRVRRRVRVPRPEGRDYVRLKDRFRFT